MATRLGVDGGGGRGYGSPSERDTEAVRSDLREGYVGAARRGSTHFDS